MTIEEEQRLAMSGDWSEAKHAWESAKARAEGWEAHAIVLAQDLANAKAEARIANKKLLDLQRALKAVMG